MKAAPKTVYVERKPGMGCGEGCGCLLVGLFIAAIIGAASPHIDAIMRSLGM